MRCALQGGDSSVPIVDLVLHREEDDGDDEDDERRQIGELALPRARGGSLVMREPLDVLVERLAACGWLSTVRSTARMWSVASVRRPGKWRRRSAYFQRLAASCELSSTRQFEQARRAPRRLDAAARDHDVAYARAVSGRTERRPRRPPPRRGRRPAVKPPPSEPRSPRRHPRPPAACGRALSRRHRRPRHPRRRRRRAASGETARLRGGGERGEGGGGDAVVGARRRRRRATRAASRPRTPCRGPRGGAGGGRARRRRS